MEEKQGIKPIIDEANGIIKSDGTTILGFDDKAGIAALLEAMRIIKENDIEHGDLQIIFSVSEEKGLLGAKNLDYTKINADFAFVLNEGGAPGEIIVKAPAQDSISIKIKGKPAHAGVSPEEGISAVMVAADFNAEVEIETERRYGSFNVNEYDDIVRLLKKIFADMGIEPSVISTGGGSDTNFFNAHGIKAVNLSVGIEKAHTLEEYINIENLVNSAAMIVQIIKEV